MRKYRPNVNRPNAFNANEVHLSGGKKGNIETVEVMQKMARSRCGEPEVREMAVEIINHYEVNSHDYLNEAMAIGDFIKSRVMYVRDANGIEQLHDPLLMVRKIKNGEKVRGDCDDMALLICTLLLSIGHSPKVRMVRYRDESGPFDHIYVVVYERNAGGKKLIRCPLDAIIKHKPIGFEVKHLSGEERSI